MAGVRWMGPPWLDRLLVLLPRAGLPALASCPRKVPMTSSPAREESGAAGRADASPAVDTISVVAVTRARKRRVAGLMRGFSPEGSPGSSGGMRRER